MVRHQNEWNIVKMEKTEHCSESLKFAADVSITQLLILEKRFNYVDRRRKRMDTFIRVSYWRMKS